MRVELGPMTGRELLERVRAGEIPDDALVLDPDRGDWMSLAATLHRLRADSGGSPT